MLMKHFSLKAALLTVLAVLGLTAAAQTAIPEGYMEVEDYLESFSTSSSVMNKTNEMADPIGWLAKPANQMVGSTLRNVSWSVNSTAAKEGGYGVGVSGSWRYGDYSKSPTEYVDIYDYIITPQVKGDLNFWVKRASSYATNPPGFKMYRMTKGEDGTFSCDTLNDLLLSLGAAELPAEEGRTAAWENKTLHLDEYTYVGIRMQCIYFDEFSASNALLPIKKDITLGNGTYLTGYSNKVKANAEGKITIGVQIPVTNASNVPLYADQEENFTLSLKGLYKQTPNTWFDILDEIAIPDLGIGETKTIEVIHEMDLPDFISLDNNGEARFRLDFFENYTGKEQTKSVSSWVEATPYTSILEIRYDKKSTSNGSITVTTVDSTKVINYGSYVGERAIEFHLRNRGGAQMTIESVDAPDWVSFENFETPFIIAPETTDTIKVKIGGEPGLKSGKITFNTDGMFIVNQIPLMGEVIGENEFFADFEGEDALKDWYLPAGSTAWSVASYSSTERNYTENYYAVEYGFNDKYLNNSYNNKPPHIIVTPKLAFAEGDSIAFYAAKKTNSGGDVKLEVKYSTDRASWIDMGTISVTNTENPDLQFSSGTSTTTTSSGQSILKRFALPMPEGEYYISLGAGYVQVDNFHGGTKVDVPYDIVSESAEVGKMRTVNHDLTFTTSFKNLLDSEIEADAQTVTLYANGEAVATAEAQALEAYGTAAYELSYMPHEAGEFELYAELAIGDFIVSSPSVNVTVLVESASADTQIGEVKTTQYNNVPLNLYYQNSRSEFIYTQDDLALLSGNKILKIAYPYYKTTDEYDTQLIEIWMENTSETEVGTSFTDPETLTKVMSVEGYHISKVGSSINDMGSMEFVLNTPFEYDGTNLRVVVQHLSTTDKQCHFGHDNTDKTRKALHYELDNQDSFLKNVSTGAKAYNGAIPVTTFFTEVNVPEVTGTVKDEEGQAIVGAVVKAQAEDSEVYYEATTDEDGAWSFELFQADLTYTLTASAEGYETSAPAAMSLEEPNEIVLTAIKTYDFTVTVVADVDETPLADLEVVLTPYTEDEAAEEAETYTATTDQEGIATFEALPLGQYIVTIAEPGVSFDAYTSETPETHADNDGVTVILEEVYVHPSNGGYEATEIEQEEDYEGVSIYDVTLTWDMGETENPGEFRGYNFAIALNEAPHGTSTVTTYTIEGLEAGNHTVTVTGTTPMGQETEPLTIDLQLEDTTGISLVEVGLGDWKYYDLRGIEVNTENVRAGLYIRVNGTTAQKVRIVE